MPDGDSTRTCPSCGGVMEFNPRCHIGGEGRSLGEGPPLPEPIYGPAWECQTDGCGEVAPAAL